MSHLPFSFFKLKSYLVKVYKDEKYFLSYGFNGNISDFELALSLYGMGEYDRIEVYED
jgi:hypothetical protein